MSNQDKPRLATVGLVTAISIAVLGAWVLAEEVTVQRNLVYILPGKGAMYQPPIANAVQGDTLTVLSREKRGWLKVQTKDNLVGYCLESSLNGSDIAPPAQPTEITGSREATAGAAAKGWDVHKWAKSRRLTTAGLDAMKATRSRVSADPNQWADFKTQGNVGVQ